MRRSPRLALALLLSASPLVAQETQQDVAVPRGIESPVVSSSPLTPLTPRGSNQLPRQLAIMSAFDMKQNEKQITCEVVFIRLSDESLKQMRFQSSNAMQRTIKLKGANESGLERIGVDFETPDPKPAETRRVQFVDEQTKKVMFEAFQRDPKTMVMMAPKLTMLPSEPAVIEMLDHQHFVTDVTLQVVGGNLMMKPTNKMISLGTKVEMCATPSADGKYIKISSKVNVSELAEQNVKQVPFAIKIKPNAENAHNREPQEFTQFIQEPKVLSRSMDDTFTIPMDRSVMAYLGSATRKVESYQQPPESLARVPYLNRLFKTTKTVAETDHLIMVITPRMIGHQSNPDVKQAGAIGQIRTAANDQKLRALLEAYHTACAEGKTDDARRIAIECLVIDPTCFGKK